MKEIPKPKNPHAVAIGRMGGYAKANKVKSSGMKAMAKIRWDKWRAAHPQDEILS